MNEHQRLQLQRMVTESGVQDNTELIRQLNHSALMREEVELLVSLRAQHGDDEEALHAEAMEACCFLYTYYTDLYHKIRKGVIDVSLLYQALDVLRRIELGDIDQHEGSFQFGTLLKHVYVDSALRRAELLEPSELPPTPAVEPRAVSWKEFKARTVSP
jgi:hypothetical protein